MQHAGQKRGEALLPNIHHAAYIISPAPSGAISALSFSLYILGRRHRIGNSLPAQQRPPTFVGRFPCAVTQAWAYLPVRRLLETDLQRRSAEGRRQ